jgi:hypothetical protein
MNDQERAKQFEIKDNINVEGISEDFVWYNSSLLIKKMGSWEYEFKRIVGVMENRHREHLTMIEDLIRENKTLKVMLKQEQSK